MIRISKISKNEKGFNAVEVLLILIILVLIVIVGWVVYGHSKKTSSATSATTDPDVAVIMNRVHQALSAQFHVVNSVQNISNIHTISLINQPGGPFWTVAGYNYYVQPENGANLLIYVDSSSSTIIQNAETLVGNVISSNLKILKLVPIPNPIPGPEGGPMLAYQNNTAVCSFETDVSPIDLSCANKSVYKNAAATIKPLATAYYTKHPKTSLDYDYFSYPTIKNSPVQGYKSATMGVDVSMGYFYQKDNEWFLYGNSMTGLDCSFTNNDARLAFMGQPCNKSDGSQGTVQ